LAFAREAGLEDERHASGADLAAHCVLKESIVFVASSRRAIATDPREADVASILG
jgi:hypothetical protein